MGFGLKRTFKKIVKPVKDILFGTKGQSASSIPAPDLSFLDDASKFDFLKDTGKYDFLLGGDYDPAKDLARPSALLSGLEGIGVRGDDSFEDLLGAISAPSSVDEVTGMIEGDRLDQLLSSIDEDIAREKGSLTMDFADRGVAGPGQLSAAEAAGLGRLSGQGLKAKAKARTDLALGELGRLKEREDAMRGAYGQKFSADTAVDQQLRSMFGGAFGAASEEDLTRELAMADVMKELGLGYADILSGRDVAKAQALSGKYSTQVAGRDQGKSGLFDRIGLNIGIEK